MKHLMFLVLSVVLLLLGCGISPEFSHNVEGKVKPWTNENFPDLSVEEGEFSFAVIPDRAGTPRKGVFRTAMAKINMLQPDFVVSVGDLIQGVPVDAKNSDSVDAQWKELCSMTESLKMPFFYCVGNHDLCRNTAKSPNRYMISKRAWEKNFGEQSYYSFVYRNALFIVLNSRENADKSYTLDPFSVKQQQWAVETLKKYPEVRWTFVFMHHPEFNHSSFQAIEKGLQGRNYTVFAGHTHRYIRYTRYNRNYYVVSTCGGVVPYEGEKYIPEHRGPEYGEMDHIVWVTLTKSGPVVANILLDGIVNDDVVTQDKNKVPGLERLDRK